MKHISEVDAVKTKMIEEMNYLCGMEIPQIQKVCSLARYCIL